MTERSYFDASNPYCDPPGDGGPEVDRWLWPLLAVVLVVLVIIGVSVWSCTTSPSLDALPLTETTVEAGDTWWSIADRCGPDHDKWAVIELLQAESGVGDMLRVGDQIVTCQAVAA